MERNILPCTGSVICTLGFSVHRCMKNSNTDKWDTTFNLIILSNCLFPITIFYVGDLFNKVVHYNNYTTLFPQNDIHQGLLIGPWFGANGCVFINAFPLNINLSTFSKWEKKTKASQTFSHLATEMYCWQLQNWKVSWML